MSSLFLYGCGDRPKDTGAEAPIDDSTPTATECSEDTDCAAGTICEAEVCVVGDRDNDPETATSVFYEEGNDGVINPPGDVDWFSIQGEAGNFVLISTVVEDSAGELLDTVVSLYDGSGKRLAWEDGYAGGTISGRDSMVYAFFPEDGTYYVKVEDIGTFYGEGGYGGGDAARYTLTVSDWGDGGDEPDSLISTGLGWAMDGSNIVYPIPFYFSEAGDKDYCLLTLPFTDTPLQVFTMQHDDGSDAEVVMSLYNEAGDVVWAAGDASRDEGLAHIMPLGTQYVMELSDKSGGYGQDYWGFAFVILDDEGAGNPREEEPNDSFAQANVLTMQDLEPDTGTLVGGYGQGYLETVEDVDVFGFTLEEELYVTAAFGAQGYGGLLVGRLEILDSTGAVVGSQDSSLGSDESLLNLGPLPAGDYALRVSRVPDSGLGGEGEVYRFGLYGSSFELE